MALCAVCQGLGPLAEYDMAEPYRTLHSLLESAGNGCEFCRLICESFKHDLATQRILKGEYPEDTPETAQVILMYPSPVKVGRAAREQYQYILVSPSAHSVFPTALELYVDPGKQSPRVPPLSCGVIR